MDPIQRANLPQAIADQIIDLISRGELTLGQKLPSQRQLAKDLGVGISSLRESLQLLAAIGLIHMHPGRGTFVTRTLEGVIGRQTSVAALVSSQDLRDLLEARQYLDSAVAVLACGRATPADLERIGALCVDMRAAVAGNDMAALEKADLAFHIAVAEASHNEVLVHLIRSVISLFSNQIQMTPFTQENLDQHLAIFQAIEAGDEHAARAAVKNVIMSSASELDLELLKETSLTA